MFTFLLGVTRVWFSMSRDGLLPGWFAKTHRHGTPAAGDLDRRRRLGASSPASCRSATAADLTNIGILPAFVVVCVAVIVLRYRPPDAAADLPAAADAVRAGARAWSSRSG